MKLTYLHSWPQTAAVAINLQKRLSQLVSREGLVYKPALIAGVDMAAGRSGHLARAAVVVLSYPALQIAALETTSGELSLPYIPGLLSFRELPLIMKVLEKLTLTPDLFLVDGQGIAHPRRLGLASHLGLLTGKPTIGCAKSCLTGRSLAPNHKAGSYTWLVDKDEVVGAAVRTRDEVKPVYVSVGHRIDLESAIGWVLTLSRGYRLPEPLRLAHRAAGGNLRGITRAEEAGCRS